ncbi:MAG: bifunctional hydroxymethylpyrimidine kinase/phosphomethylpyrimidine kinase [Methylacidiphilales bacterium]|nr:bifunctional hydroxymethylpyrimidine kinase/phosphomethylpyrimidine kinase [Candidatus Methylacidiphilales bacterium]MDW8349321.1 bifunctional hydroxymethylpyrimidine kinase/phosphomethylpyrimidine kinase [Verrucomicrobiae bacterium]
MQAAQAGTIPVALTIAGSDNSGGAGIQADLKTFHQLGCFGVTALTCVVAEHPGKVSRIVSLDPSMVSEQIRLCAEVYPLGAIKTGMLFSYEIITAVAATLKNMPSASLIIDPVMVASSGARLLLDTAINALKELLFPLATLITPNRDEAEILWGNPINNESALRECARELSSRYHTSFLVKGGHLQGDNAIDVLCQADGDLHEFSAPRVPQTNPHGTGCTFSAAITAYIAHGHSLVEAVAYAKDFITEAVRTHHRFGPYALLNHHARAERSRDR